MSGLSAQTHMSLLVVSVAAAITVTLMTFMRLPISTSQAIIGAIAGVGLATNSMQWNGLIKVGNLLDGYSYRSIAHSGCPI